MSQLRALIVDDSLTVRMDLMEGLGAAGFETVGCKSVAEARAALKEGEFDIVLLDVRLGDGDGIELLSEIRAAEGEDAHVPVMMLSTEKEVSARVRGLTHGADEYAGKPYVLSYVVARARELVHARTRAIELDEGPTVLVIDDSLSFREAIRDALEEAQYRAIVAVTGEEGLEMAAASRPALIIVDSDLPGIDGATVIRRLRLDPLLRRTPCVMITASAEGELNAFEAGVDAYLPKRTPPAEVVARVSTLLAPVADITPAGGRSVLGANKVLLVGEGLAELKVVLQDAHFDVATASTPDEAILLLNVDTPGCILMAVGAAGECRAIRDAVVGPSAVLALLPDEDSKLAIDCLAAGADEVVKRQTPPALLVARLRAQLGRKQIQEELERERNALVERELATAEMRAAQALADERARHLAELEQKNEELAVTNSELEAFSYSVSHDLRAPLRAIIGFSRALEEDQGDKLDEVGRQHLNRVLSATARMSELIDDLLQLSRVSNAKLRAEPIDVSSVARIVANDLQGRDPARVAEIDIAAGMHATGDPGLVRALLENLMGNAWKFTSKREKTRLEVGLTTGDEGEDVFYVRDNGVGFDMTQAPRLFRPFQRLHTQKEFEGTGIGLATVRRIVVRHGGKVWIDSKLGEGTTVLFTIPKREARSMVPDSL